MKPHIYKFYGRWAWSSYGKVKAEGASLVRLGILYNEADDFVKRLNHRAGR